MKLILLGIACILFGIAILFLEAMLFTDEVFFEILSLVAPFAGLAFAFAGVFINDKKN